MEKTKDENRKWIGLKNLIFFDPKELPYEQQNLCTYLRELEGEAEEKLTSGNRSG